MFRSKSVDFSWIRREQRRRRPRSPAGRSLSQIGVERLTETGCGSMPGSVVELSPAVGIRRNRGLADINPAFVSRSGLSTSSEVETSRGSLRIQHRPSSSPAGAGGGATDGHSRFPKLNECAHFHYEVVDLGPVTLQLHEDGLRPWATAEEGSTSSSDTSKTGLNSTTWAVQVSSRGKSWIVRRTLDNFRLLDDKLHRCIYDRKFSNLPDLNSANFDQDEADAIRPVLSDYLTRLSRLAGNLMNCGPVLNWLELDNRGHRLIALEDADINTPAVAAAYAVRRYAAQASDEISFEVGDMISVIDMPPPEESVWWRGKRGFDVGFFPSDCVRLIGDKVPKGIPLAPPASASPILSHSAPPSLPPFNPTVASSVVASSAVVTASAALAAGHEGGMELKRQSSSSLQLPAKPVLRKHGKLISFFRSFILSRPSRRKLKQSGILKERVFGCDLGEHLLNSGRDVPLVLKCCAEFIETHGIVDGIYRLSGVTSNIQKLRHAFDEDRVPGLNEDEAIRQDIHAVSSLLKMYFRELPNPLCTYQLYDQFVTAVQGPEDLRLAKMRQVVQQLPPPHYRTLEYLMRHLALVASECESTGMTAKNVAIVWAPNLLRCKELEVGGVAALQGVGVQAVVTEYLVRFVDLIFSDKIPVQAHTSSIDTPKRSRPKSLAISTPTKLLSLEEARLRALQAAEKNESSYIEVGGGPASLPPKYHTVIELPDRKRSLKNKKSPSGWKSFFAKGRSQSSTSTSQAKAQRKASSASAGSTGHVSRKDSSLAGAPGRATVTYTRQRLRPVKSAESLVSSATPSNRNSVTLESPPPPHPVNVNVNLSPSETNKPIPLAPPTPPPTPPPAVPSPTATVASEASRCHSRSVSHDSYFRVLNLAVVGGRELCLEEEGSDLSKDSLHFMEENQRSWLSYASNGSDVRCNMTLDDSDLKVMSSREMLVDPAAHKASSDESAVDGSHPDDRHDLGVANPTYDALPTTTPLTVNLQHIQAEVYHNHLALAASPSPSPDDTEAQIPDLPLEDASPVSPSPLLTHAPPPTVSSQSSFSYAAATVSENESFTLHSPMETLESLEPQNYSLLAEIDAQAARNFSSSASVAVSDSRTAETQALLSYENVCLQSSTCNDLYGNLSYDQNDDTLDENDAYENVDDVTDVPAQAYENVSPEPDSGNLPNDDATELAYENVEPEAIAYENIEQNLEPNLTQENAEESLNYENVDENLTYENVDSPLGETSREVYENIQYPSPVPVASNSTRENIKCSTLVTAEKRASTEFLSVLTGEENLQKEEELQATNYENIVIPGEVNVYEDVIPPPPLIEPNTEEISEMQYQQVQVLRRSIQEVNSLFLPTNSSPAPQRPSSQQEAPPTSQLPPQRTVEPVLRVPLSLSLPSLESSTERFSKTNFSLPLTPTSPPKPEPSFAAYQEVTSKRKIESEIGRDLLHAGKMRSELERVRQDEPVSLSPSSAPPPLPIKKRNSMHSPTTVPSEPVLTSPASGKSLVSPSHQIKDERRKETKPLWRPGHERKASVKELLSKFETETSPGEPGGKRLGRATSNGELKIKETRLDRKSESENSHCFEDKNLVNKDWLSRTKSLDRMVLTTLDPQTDFNLCNIDKTSTERLEDNDEHQYNIGLKSSICHVEPVSESLKQTSRIDEADTSPVLGDNADFKTVLLSASVDVNDPCARLRIERYKAERRSFLREKFKPESFRGEKDDVLQRLKQKASSPTSDTKETASTVNVNTSSSGADSVAVPILPAAVPVSSSPVSVPNRTPPSPISNQPGVSSVYDPRVDAVPAPCSRSSVLNQSATGSVSSPRVAVPVPSPPCTGKPKDPDVIDEDVNVRERAALFARSQPVHSHPSAKRKKEDANLSSSEETNDPRVPAFSSPSPLKSASMSSINSAKSPRRIRDMAAMFEVSSPSSGKP